MRAWWSALWLAEAVLLGIDMGNEYTKVGLVRPGKAFEIVHNVHSKRKSPTAISFMEATRAFGDDALPHQGKKPTHVPMFFPALAGKTEAETALPERFYPYKLAESGRGTHEYALGEEERNLTQIGTEELIGQFVDWSRRLAEDAAAADGATIQIREAALTVPTDVSYAARLARLDALEIAGLAKTYLVRELGAAAIHRGVDWPDWSANSTDANATHLLALFVNVGSTKAEACVVKYSPVKLLGQTTSHIEMLGCGIEHGLGGHYFDLALAEKALGQFVEKNPKLDGVKGSTRALRKLVVQAEKTKVTLSANQQHKFSVEGLYEDTDFGFPVQRSELADLIPDLKERLTKPILAALERANETLDALSSVEVVGGGSRSPLVGTALGEIINAQRETPLELGRHLNGDEAMALGSCFFVANLSTHFKVRKMWYSDSTEYEYKLRVTPLHPEQLEDVPAPDKGEDDKDATWENWRRDVTIKAGSRYPVGKPVRIRAPFDLKFTIEEDGKPVQELEVLIYQERKDLEAKGTYNLTSPLPTVSFMFGMGSGGVAGVAEIEAHMFYSAEQVTYKKIKKEKEAKPEEKKEGDGEEKEGEEKEGEEKKEDEEKKEEDEEKKEEEEEKKEEEEEKKEDDEEKTEEEKPDEAAAEKEGEEGVNATDANATNATAEPEMEKVVSYKKKKAKVAIKISTVELPVRPLMPKEVAAAKTRLLEMHKADQYVKDLEGARNALETAIYLLRDKSEDENIVAVSTEEEVEKLRTLASETEDWLMDNGYEESTTLTVLEEKIAELEGSVNVLRNRALELEHRPLVIERVEQVLAYVNETVEFVKTNRTHVTPEQREVCTNKTEAFVAWWENVTALQAEKKATDEPAYTGNDVMARLEKLQKEAEKLMRIQYIPVPPPTPKGPYDDMFKDSNFSKEWFENLKKNLSDENFSNFNFSNFNFSNLNLSNTTEGAGEGSESPKEEETNSEL